MAGIQETTKRRTILIIGGSYGGISCAHYFLQHALPDLQDGYFYNVTLVITSAKFMARTGSPRAAVSSKHMPPEKVFWDIAAGFKQYPEDQFNFLEGRAMELNEHLRTATFTTKTNQHFTIQYYALMIATGSSPKTPLLGVCDSLEEVERAHVDFQSALNFAKLVVVAGGGPAAVEVAAEVAQEGNGSAGWFACAEKKMEVMMLVRSSRLLNGLPASVAKAAEKQLNSLGVTIMYNTTVLSTSTDDNGLADSRILASKVAARTVIKTDNGHTLDADLFIPATGVTPNTSFLPKSCLNSRGYIRVDPSTLRVEEVGPRIYAIGDCADYKRRDLLDLYTAIPVVITNLKRDIMKETGHMSTGDALYRPDPKHTQLIPIGTGMGVGLISGWFAPSWLVWWIKGRDYLIGLTPKIVDGKTGKEFLNALLQ